MVTFVLVYCILLLPLPGKAKLSRACGSMLYRWACWLYLQRMMTTGQVVRSGGRTESRVFSEIG
jgi:hypothetical protein